MATSTNKLALPQVLVSEMFNKTRGHSTIAKLCGADPVAFNGNQVMTFTLDGEVALVGEAGQKPAGAATFEPVTIAPVKVVYQHRLTDEFVRSSDEARLPYLKAFTEGFSAKIARGLDIMAFHGVSPATKASVAPINTYSFKQKVTQIVNYSGDIDEGIEDAVAAVQGNEGTVSGIAFAPDAASAMGKLKADGVKLYPEFAFGGHPDSFAGMGCDVNTTVGFNNSGVKAIVGDFQNALRWGYAAEVPMEIIEYGDPDGLGDLKRTNQIVLRAEAYIGWGILAPEYFAIVGELAEE